MAEPVKVPLEGEVLAGKYRIERTLGRGGMGVVVAATHVHLRQPVAIKFLLGNADRETVIRFNREARAAVRLKSDHVARVLDVGELPDGAPYMVMEYLNGHDLSQRVRNEGPLSVRDAVLYLLHTCEAIAEAHSIGIIHRDLKPANLFLTRGADGANTIKVLDFGISKIHEEQAEGVGVHLTQTTAFLGSPLYMSPEQIKSAREVTVCSDIWSLGAILYELLAGQVPFNASSLSELILMVNMEPPRPLLAFRNDVPAGLDAAILRCLEKRPEARFQSVGELAWAIFEYGPIEARASAEKIVRTLETTGARVSRTTSPPGRQMFPSSPPAASQQGAIMGPAWEEVPPATPSSTTAPASTAPLGPTAMPGNAPIVPASPARSGDRLSLKGLFLIAVVVFGVTTTAAVVILMLWRPADSPVPTETVAPVVSAEVPSLHPVSILTTAIAVPDPPSVVPSAAPPRPSAAPPRPSAAPPRQSISSATGPAMSARGRQLSVRAPASVSTSNMSAATAPASPRNPLDMKVKD